MVLWLCVVTLVGPYAGGGGGGEGGGGMGGGEGGGSIEPPRPSLSSPSVKPTALIY